MSRITRGAQSPTTQSDGPGQANPVGGVPLGMKIMNGTQASRIPELSDQLDAEALSNADGTDEQRNRNWAAIEWLHEWRAQPPVEGEPSWEEFEKLMKDSAMSYRKRDHG